MEKQRLTLALAGFWHVLKLAVGYYILMSILPPQTSQAEKLLFLWFGSPALIVAGFFFFPYFKPDKYRTCIDPARLAIGFDACIAVSICLFMAVSSLVGPDQSLNGANTFLIYLICTGAAGMDCLILLLLSRNQSNDTQES